MTNLPTKKTAGNSVKEPWHNSRTHPNSWRRKQIKLISEVRNLPLRGERGTWQRTSFCYLECLFIRNLSSIVPSANKFSDAKTVPSRRAYSFSLPNDFLMRYIVRPFFCPLLFRAFSGLNHLLTSSRLSYAVWMNSTSEPTAVYCELYWFFPSPFLLITCNVTPRGVSINFTRNAVLFWSREISRENRCSTILNIVDPT